MKPPELSVLVVEDDEFQRRTLIGMLRSLGVTTIAGAANGREALAIIHAAPVDVAICDLNMPEMDGMEFLRRLSQEHRNIAIVITSALDGKLLASVGRMSTLFGIRLLGLIEKPITLSSLQRLLLKHGEQESEPGQARTTQSFSLDEILHGIRSDQFEPYFQPKVGLKNGRLVGAEALARWRHPDHGVVAPHAFIPLLEQSGNIDDLTFTMLEKSAAACRQFHDGGHLLTVSVNLSMVSLNAPDLADRIAAIVGRAGIEPQYIVLEITESAAMSDAAQSLENLARLCMNGFTLSIDDYGTGYSSLQQLTRIAFGELKIDQSFVKDAADNAALRIVVESSIDMARKLRVKSVAEGAETQQDWDMLKTAGCDAVQGYFIAAPMDMEAFRDFMASYTGNSAARQPSPADALNPANVLVVDDNDFTRKIVMRVLNSLGYTHTTGVDGAASALKLLADNSYDLIITDVHMPGINGLEFVRQIRSGKTHAKPDTRIVVLTSFSQTEVLGTALALDINGFLVKPIIPAIADEKLAQAMSETLRLHPPFAYEAIRTDLRSLPRNGCLPSHAGGESAVALHCTKPPEGDISRHPVRDLHPGMRLAENIHLTDGTLLMSLGHVFSELSINRLNDLQDLLPSRSIAIHIAPRNSLQAESA